MSSGSSFNIFACGNIPRAKEKMRKSASTMSPQSTTSSGQAFLPRGIALEAWNSRPMKPMKYSKSSPGNLRALVDKPLVKVQTQSSWTASQPRQTPYEAEISDEALPKQQRTRALVYNWPVHFCKENMLQVTPGPVLAPYELDVRYDVRAREHEFVKQKAYVVAFDAEIVRKKFAAGMGVNPLEATDSFMSRDCCCSDVVPLSSSHGRVKLKLKIASTSDAELVFFLRVIRSGNLKNVQDWYPIGDAVVVKVDTIADDVRRSLAETTAKDLMAEEAPLSNEALEALKLEMDRIPKIESFEELKTLEASLEKSLKGFSDDSEERLQHYLVAKARCEAAQRSIEELRSALSKVEEQIWEAERSNQTR